MSETRAASGLYVSGDLVLGGPVLAAMETICDEVTRALSGRGLIDRLHARPVDLLVIDLEAEDLNLPALGEIARTHGRPIIVAYAPHVASARIQAARDAGFAAVISRGQASSQLSSILRQLVAASPRE